MKGDEHNHHELESSWTRHSSVAAAANHMAAVQSSAVGGGVAAVQSPHSHSHSHSHLSSSHSSHSQSDPYQTPMSYYTHTAAHMFPYSANDLQPSSQPWSNGEPITFLGSYGTADHNAVAVGHSAHSSHYTAMDAMFGSQSTYGFGSPFNAFFPSATSTDPFWGNSTAAVTAKPTRTLGGYATRMHDTTASAAADYGGYGAPHDSYGAMTDTHDALSLKHIDAGMSGLTLDHIKVSDQFAAKAMHSAFSSAMTDSKKMDALGTSSSSSSGVVGQGVAPKKMTWASIASQPAKPQPKSLKSKMSSSVLTGSTTKHLPPANMDAIGTWESKNGSTIMKSPSAVQAVTPPTIQSQRSGASMASVTSTSAVTAAAVQSNVNHHSHSHSHSQSSSSSSWAPQSSSSSRQTANRSQTYSAVNSERANVMATNATSNVISSGPDNSANSSSSSTSSGPLPAHPVLDKLRVENNYNPKEFDLNPKNARFFIIKSYSEDDIHRSIKYSIWCSTEHGNKRLDSAFRQQETKGPIYLLFSVNGSGHFCGMAQMMSSVDYNSSSSVWAQDKWKGQFKVRWIYVKDVPNAQLRHIRLENNENKPVTNSRDTQEVPFEKGKQVIKIMHHYKHTTSIFDDFLHYEKRQEEESQRRYTTPTPLTNNNNNANDESRIANSNANANANLNLNMNMNGPQHKKWTNKSGI